MDFRRMIIAMLIMKMRNKEDEDEQVFFVDVS